MAGEAQAPPSSMFNALRSGVDVAPALERGDFNVFRAGYAEQASRGFRPRSDTRPIRLKLPLDWNMDPLKDRNWCFQLHAWRMLQPIWSEFYGRDWDRLKSEVMPWIRDWYAYHVRQRRKSAFMWYDMAAGLRAQHLALLIHLCQQGSIHLDEDEAAEVEQLAAMHIAKLRDPSFISKGNHGIFQLVGLRLLGIVWKGRPETAGEEAYSSDQMRALIESQFGPQGVHVENSPDYHNFAITHFSRIRPELFPSIANVFERKLREAREVSTWFTLPNGSVAAIGDSEGNGRGLTRACVPTAVSRSTWGDRVIMRDLSDGGYVAIRTDLDTPPHREEMLIIKGQAITTSHAHADHLGFELYAHGRPLLVDSGKYTYNKSKWRSYFTSDRAHNIAGLADRSFGPYETDLEATGLTSVRHEDGHYLVNGQVSRGGCFVHRREFIYLPGDRLILSDEVEVPEGSVPAAYFHLAEHADAVIVADGIEMLVGGRRVALLVYPEDQFQAQIVRGQEDPRIQGWVSPSYGKLRPATVIELIAKEKLDSWVTQILLDEPKVPDDLLERPLPHEISIPFLYSCRTDRTLPRDGALERRVLLEYFSGDPTGIEQKIGAELEDRGFAKTRSKPEEGGVRAYYRHGDGTRVNVLVRSAEAFSVRSAGAVGSLYMAFTVSN